MFLPTIKENCSKQLKIMQEANEMTNANENSKEMIIPTEQPAQRTAFCKIFTVGAGKYRSFQGGIQIHSFDSEKQEWQEVDARFKPAKEIQESKSTGITDPVYISLGPVLTVAAGTAGKEAFLSVTDEKGCYLSLGLENARPVTPEVPEDECSEEYIKETASDDPALAAFLRAMFNAQGTVRYTDLFPGIEYNCHTDGQVENTFVFRTPESAQEIILLAKAEGLSAREEKDNSVVFTDETGKTVFTICPPYIYDAAGEEGKVSVSLEEKEGSFRICYAPDPAFMRSASYPVTLDPVIKSANVASSVEDTYVSSIHPNTNYNSVEQMHVNNSGSNGTCHALIRFTSLPALGANHFITNGSMVLNSVSKPNSTIAFYAREITGNWTANTVTYNSGMPSWNTQTVQDYAIKYYDNQYKMATPFDITQLTRNWYRNPAENYGVIITSSETVPCNGSFYAKETSLNLKPYLKIEYASLAGLEDYMTYDSVSAGRAGTGNVSLVNGNMIFLHSDTEMNGARMPVSVTHVYNSCDANSAPFGCGYGWRTNYHQTLHKEYLDQTIYYVYTDGDGTEHWFKPTPSGSTTDYRDESGLSMKLKVEANNITITDKGDNVMTFPKITATPTSANPVTGKVLITTIADSCGNTVTVSSTGMKITQIEDGATENGSGRITAFDYTGNYLTAIRTPWQTGTDCVRFSYTGGSLTGVTYEDGRTSSFTYQTDTVTGHRLLTHATGPEGITAEFTYTNTNAVGGLLHIVSETEVTAGTGNNTLTGSHTSYDYGSRLCLVTDCLTNKTLRYHFNDDGNCTGVDDGLGYAVFAEYDRSGENANAPVNHATSTSRIQRAVNNLLADGLQNSTGTEWTKYGTGTIQQAAYLLGFGSRAKKYTVANGNTLYLRQNANVTAGKTYTLSGYTQSLGAKTYLRVVAGNQTFLSLPVEVQGAETQTGLERTRVTFTVPSGVSSISCDMVAEGTARGTMAWWDSAQLEEGETANHVNLMENSRMTRASGTMPYGWTADSNCEYWLSRRSGASCSVPMPDNLTGDVLHVAGQWDRTIRAFQTLRISGSAGDKLTAGGWCSSYAKKMDTVYSVYCRMQFWFSTTNNETWSGWTFGGKVDFNHEEGIWQFACGNITAPIDYNWVRVAIYYNKQMNYADFTNLFVYKEAYGSDYVYDSNGNRTKKTAPSGITGNTTYDDYNNILTKAAPGRTVGSSYNWGSTEAEKKKHLLQSVTTPLGTKTSFQYDTYGNLTQSKTEDSTGSLTKYIQSTTTYTSAGTYAATQTDARGKVVTTVTDPDRGTVTSVTDPKNQTVTNTYDALRRLTKTSTMLTSTKEVKSENTYDAVTGYLTSTKHNTTTASSGDVTYGFTYDALGRQKSVSVGSSVLSTTSYNALQRTVESVTFGDPNSPVGSVHYRYDGFGRVTGIRYDSAADDRFTYGYDAQGRVAYITDHVRNMTVYTDYDLAGRPCLKTQLAGTAHVYTGKLTYNAYELPNTFTELVGTTRTKYTTGFGYDIENRVTALTYSTGSAAYTYDKLGRITKRRITPASTNIDTDYTYLAGGHGTNSTSELIQKITQGGVTLTYSYDDNGNITQVKTGSQYTKYVYDAIGQLTRVNDQTDLTAGTTGTTWAFTYDLGGNILTKKAYVYTTASSLSGLTPTESHTYTYGNTSWKDQLTAYDGVTIQYDAIGNPTNDGTWQYTWQHGKQLQQMSKTGMTVSFEYNEDGLRTKKTVAVGNSTAVTEYILHGKNVVHLTQGNDVLHFYYDAQNRPAIVIFNSTAYGYLYDLQGDVVALVDGTGTKVVEYTYDAWGKPTGKTGTMAGTLGTVQPFRYRGYVFDEETGLYYLRSRCYNSNWQRFVCADHIINFNLFIYCNNTPIVLFDQDGYAPCIPYNPQKAVEFALRYWDCMENLNGRYFYERNNNCARFVSACVFWGLGGKDFDDWHDRDYITKNDVSSSWRKAKKQYEYFLNSEYCGCSYDLEFDNLKEQIGFYKLRPGDLVYKQYIENGTEKWHAVIITKIDDGMVYYTANSDNVANEPITTLWQHGEQIQVHVICMYSQNDYLEGR